MQRLSPLSDLSRPFSSHESSSDPLGHVIRIRPNNRRSCLKTFVCDGFARGNHPRWKGDCTDYGDKIMLRDFLFTDASNVSTLNAILSLVDLVTSSYYNLLL